MRTLAFVYAGFLITAGVMSLVLGLLYGAPKRVAAAPDHRLDAIQGDWVLVTSHRMMNVAAHVAPLDGFPSEAACRAKIASLHDSAKTRGIHPPTDYDCWPRERVRQVRQASRSARP